MSYDVEKAASELMIEPSDLTMVLEYFFSEALDIFEEYERALKSSDCKALKKIFHTLKGSSSNLRLTSLSKLAADLEAEARPDRLDHIAGLMQIFQGEFFTIREKVRQYCAG